MQGFITLLTLSILFATVLCALPLASYTVTGTNQYGYAIKNVLDTANSRYSNTISATIQGNTIVTRTVVTSSISYQQTIEDSFYCFCYNNSQAYSGLVSYWDNFSLQSDAHGVSKYTATNPSYYPACPTDPTYTITEFLVDSGSYPLNISYPYSTYNPYLFFAESTYSATVDTTAFTLTCCTTSTALCK